MGWASRWWDSKKVVQNPPADAASYVLSRPQKYPQSP